MKNLKLATIAFSALCSVSSWAGNQRCVLKSGASPFSEFTIHYDIQPGRAALRFSTAGVVSGNPELVGMGVYEASGADAMLNITVMGRHEGVVLVSFGPLAQPFLSVEIEQSGSEYRGFSRYHHDGQETGGLYACEAFPAEIASVISRADGDLVSSDTGF